MCSQLATINSLSDRIIIKGKCDHNELQSLPLDNAVIICDCEGYELELLDPEIIPILKQVRLLVELHDMFVPGLSGKLLPRAIFFLFPAPSGLMWLPSTPFCTMSLTLNRLCEKYKI